jgi:hypothetical protein
MQRLSNKPFFSLPPPSLSRCVSVSVGNTCAAIRDVDKHSAPHLYTTRIRVAEFFDGAKVAKKNNPTFVSLVFCGGWALVFLKLQNSRLHRNHWAAHHSVHQGERETGRKREGGRGREGKRE